MILFSPNHDALADPKEQIQLELLALQRFHHRGVWTEPGTAATAHTIYFANMNGLIATINGNTLTVPENHFLLVPKGQFVSCTTDPRGDAWLYKMTFRCVNLPNMERLDKPYLTGHNAHIADLFYHLYHAQKSKRQLASTSDALVALILEQCFSSQDNGIAGEKIFNQFCDYVESNLGGDLSADAIAAALRYNKDYISRIVKQFSGKCMKEYISCERLYLAKQMLVRRENTVADVSAALNFSSEELFCKFFRYYTSMTPTEYRRLFPE